MQPAAAGIVLSRLRRALTRPAAHATSQNAFWLRKLLYDVNPMLLMEKGNELEARA